MSNPTDDTIAVNIAIDIDRHPSFVPCNVFLLAHFCLGRVFVDVLCLSVVVCVLLLLLLSEAHFNVPAGFLSIPSSYLTVVARVHLITRDNKK